MTKKEIIWRYLLTTAMDKKQLIFTQKDVAKTFNISTSTVFNALKVPRKLGAIEVTGRFFRLIDKEKLLILWATMRNIQKDIYYSTYVSDTPEKIEGLMPADCIFGAFSAYRLKYQDAPADYDQIYVYSNNLQEIKKRFPPAKTPFPGRKLAKNLFIMKPDSYLNAFGSVTPDTQTFVDLWNIPKWYSKDYLDSLKGKMNL